MFSKLTLLRPDSAPPSSKKPCLNLVQTGRTKVDHFKWWVLIDCQHKLVCLIAWKLWSFQISDSPPTFEHFDTRRPLLTTCLDRQLAPRPQTGIFSNIAPSLVHKNGGLQVADNWKYGSELQEDTGRWSAGFLFLGKSDTFFIISPIACCLPASYCLLPAASCLLPAASCLLPARCSVCQGFCSD